jgi:hypothetical protein
VRTLLDGLPGGGLKFAPGGDYVALRGDRPLRDQRDIDSFDFLNVVIRLHDKLAINVPEADYQKLATLDSGIDYLASRLGDCKCHGAVCGGCAWGKSIIRRDVADGFSPLLRTNDYLQEHSALRREQKSVGLHWSDSQCAGACLT